MEEFTKNQEVKEQPVYEEELNQEPEKKEAGVFAIIVSVLFPIIGVIIYFVKKNEVKNPNAYLWGAFAGFIIGLIINLMSL